MKTGVIGSGIGGLAIAIRLALKGNEVTVFEKNEQPGGKISQLFADGYRFDTGPSLFTLPHLVEELFTLAGKKREDYLPYQRIETNCRYYFPDGTDFVFYRDEDRLRSEIREKTNEDPQQVFRRLARSKQVYEIGAPVFLFSNFHKLSNFNTPPFKKVALKWQKLDFFRTMHGANSADFEDWRLVRIFDRYATYNGSNPYKAPATLNMIAHLENNVGTYFPKRGMYDIVSSLYKLAQETGVGFRFGTKVEEIGMKHRQVTGLRTGEGFIPFDCVVSDVDACYAANCLMEPSPYRHRLNRAEPSSSALIFYWGINRTFPELDLHNILFASDYKQEFGDLFTRKTIHHDPTIYIFISSKLVPEDAPKGCENWFVMVNAPADSGQNWDKLIRQTRAAIIRKINKSLHVTIEKCMVNEHVASPLTIERNTLSRHGALYGASSNSMFSAFLRHPNVIGSIKNLYFVGGSVHPGGGIPLCLASALIVDREIAARVGDE